MIKDFKRVISMILVVAMLASFVGIPSYSPVSIEVEAAGDQDKNVITTPDGLRIDMASVLYKHRALDAETITIAGSSTTDVNDYIISTEHNYNLDYSLTFPAGVTHFKGSLSLDGVSYGGLWGTLSKDNWNNGSVAYFSRTGEAAQNYDYGALYNSKLKGKGVEGFRDVEKIYWKIEYSSDGGSTFASYEWSVDVEFAPISLEFAKSAVNHGKPNGSFAATNVASLDIPVTLYTDGSKIIKSVSDPYDGEVFSFDTELKITVPGGAYVSGGTTDYNGDGVSDAYIRLNIIDFNENIKYVYSLGDGYDPYPSGLTENGKVVYPAVDSATGKISENGSNWDVTFDLENLTHIDSIQLGSVNHKYICYRIDYIIPQTTLMSASNDADGIQFSELGIETQNVVYSQFAASAVKTVPNFRTSYTISNFGGWYKGDHNEKYVFNFEQQANFHNMLKTTGVTVETSYRSSTNSAGEFSHVRDVTSGKRFYGIEAYSAKGYNSRAIYSALYGGVANWAKDGTDTNRDVNSLISNDFGSSSNTMGATIFYDKYYYEKGSLTQLTYEIDTEFLTNNLGLYTNYLEHYREGFITSADGPQYEYFGDYGYAVKGSGWQSTGSSADGALNYKDLSGGNVNNISGSIGRTGDGLPSGKPVTGTKTLNYYVNLSGSAAQYNFMNIMVSYDHYDSHGTADDQGSITGVGLGYHIDLIPVNRSASHTLIDNAIKNNYIKAEMNGNWWKTYRENILYAYYNIGYLNSTGDTFALGNTAVLDNPVYDGADYDRLAAALKDNPAYEKGNEKNASDGILINDGAQWDNMKDDTVTGEYYYTADTWARFKAARQRAHSLAFACYRTGGTYNYGYIQDFSNHWDAVNKKYYIHSQTTGLSLLYCYAQDAIDEATEELIAAKNALKLKSADYSAMGDAINAATDAGDTEHIAKHNNATYNADALKFRVQNGDYTGDYYGYDGQKISVYVGTAVSQKNFSTTTASALRTALQKRMFVYDWNGDGNGNGMPDKLENGSQVFNYAHNNTFSPLAPTSGSFVDNVFTTDYAKAENETKLSDGASKYYLSIGYQSAINAAVIDINNKAAALRLRINPLALGTAIENARYIDVNGTRTFLYTLQGSNDNYEISDVYTQESWDNYVRALQVSVNVIYAQATPLSQSTSFDYTTLSARDTDLASGTPYYSTMTYIDANGDSQSYTPANRQQEYNMAITNAENAQQLLIKYADYSEALARINGTAYIPTYDQNGAQAVTGFTGETWYTAETWNAFVNARNALANILYLNGAANASGYSYSDGVANKYTRGRLTEPQEETSNTIASAVAAFDDAYSKLVLKTMAEYVDGSNTFDAINADVQTKLKELEGSSPVYTIVDGALDKTSTTVTNYRNYSELVAAADIVAAIASTDSLVGNKVAYESAVTAFNNKYNEVKAAFNTISEAGWLDIFEHLSVLADGTTTSVTAENVLAKFDSLYVDNGTVKQAIADIITAYGNAKQGTHLPEGSDVTVLNTQGKINEQVEALYVLLTDEENALPSSRIQNTISDIKTEMGRSFVVYNPYDFSKYNEEGIYKNALYIWGDDSATIEANKHNGLSAVSVYGDMSDESYAAMVGYLNTAETENNAGHTLWTTSATEIENVANTLRVQAGLEVTGDNYAEGTIKVLKESTVKVDVLQGAFTAAARAYGYIQNVTADNPEADGEDYAYGKFTSESVEEIRGVVEYAINYLTENNLATVTETKNENGVVTAYTVTVNADSSYEDQLEIDKLVFFILDEIENDSADRLLLAKAPTAYHFRWTHTKNDDGVCTDAVPALDETAFTGDYSWENLLHKKIESEGLDNGFVLANAYYGFLDQQINTPYSEEFIGVVWARAEDGTLSLITKDETAVGATTFTDATWSNYITARNNAIAFARDKNSAAQAEVDAVVEALYIARTSLQLRSFASNTTDFATAQEWYYKDLQKYGLTTPITHYVVNEDGTTSTYDENVYIYTGVDEDPVYNEETGKSKGKVLSEIDAYWALYASKDTKADFDSIDEAIASRNAIRGTYDENGELTKNGLLQDYNVTLKKKNDASFRVGADELIANFIAGKWEDGVYDSDLIAKTDADWDGTAWKAGSQGAEIQRMLTAIEAMFTDVEVTVQFTDNADVEKCTYSTTFGTDVRNKTDELYNYTTGQNGNEGVYAQNLQFAINMRDNELYKFLGMQIPVGMVDAGADVQFYYGEAGLITDEEKYPGWSGMTYNADIYVFKQDNVNNTIKVPITRLFDEPTNWPRIYQVNGLEYNSEGESCEVSGYEYDGTSSYIYTGDGADTEVTKDIIAILNAVGSHSQNYITALDQLNNYNVDAFTWLRDNAIVSDGNGRRYVLAENVASQNGPANYNMSKEELALWYTDGRGKEMYGDGRRYYLYESTVDGEENVNSSQYHGWFYDETIQTVEDAFNIDNVNAYLYWFTTDQLSSIEYLKIGQTVEGTGGSADAIAEIKRNGWGISNHSSLLNCIISEQLNLDIATSSQYQALQSLQLLPATDAYREVVQLYWESQKQKGEYNSTNVGITPNSTTEIDKAIFYNADANFVTRLQDRDAGMTYETDSITGYYKGYTANLPADYNTTDADGNYTNYQSFYTNLLNEYASSATQKTIDCADEVNGAYTKENQSLKAQLIDLIAKLELTALNYEKLNSLVKAFYKNYETETEKHGLSANAADFITLHGLSGYTFYNYTMYTPESLKFVVDTMYGEDVITQTLHGQSKADDYEFKLDFDVDKNETGHRGTIYTNATSNEQIERAYQAVKEAIKALKLKDADLDALDAAVNRGLAQNSEDYDVVSETGKAAWDALQTAIKAAQDVYYVTGEDGKLVLKTGLDIRSQNDIDAKTKAINDAIANLKFKADTAAPKMTVDTTPESMRMYYNDATIAGKDAAVAQGGLPATGTFIMPVKSGYSLVVYTNELNPRIAIDLQDLGITGSPLTTKPEKLSATAQRTTGATANIITGTKFISENNVATFNGIESSVVTSSTTYSAQTYKDASASSYDDNSSLFAILAPTFSETGDQKQAVLYQLTVSDSGASQNTVQGDTTPTDNKVKEFTFANGEVVKLTNDDTAPNTVSIYVYYRNTMPEKDAEGNVNDEGIDYTGTALTAAHGGNASFVTNNIEGQKGTWQNIFGLQRSFPNIKAWELIDENKDGYVNWIYPNHIIGESTADDDSLTKGPIYYDPNFGQMNTGSFAYVLDENKAIDKAVIDEYNSVKTANGTETTDMDYAAATAAKDLLLKTMTRAHFDDIKSSNASFARFGSYQYWSQGLNGKYENGDLVFVHVVDRWGNVCNRIMQVSDYDGIAPEVNSNGAGTATIVEQGGSGLETVGIWLNGEQTAPVQTNSAAITLNATDDVTVEEGTDLVFAEGITVKENSDVNVYENADGVMVAQVSGNKFTVDGLVPGKEYQVGACDTAGNVTAPSVLADANGNVEITVVEDEEATFSLNSDIVVTINTGISSSVIDAEVEGNVIANKYIDHIIVTKDNVTQIKVVNLADNKETVYKPASTIMYDYEDGTIGWETYYKLTEGQHSYKVYAMVDGAYEEMGVTYTFDATLKTIPLSLSVVGNGKIVLEYSGAAPANVSNFKLVNIPYGAKVTIKATSLDSNSKFYYWQNDVTNRVLNVNEEMSFTAVAAVDYDAYFTNSLCTTSEYKYVVYVNNAGNVIKSVELRDGNNDYVVPLGPSLPDHEFKGWAMSKAEVIASEEDIVVVRPIYTLNAEYTVEITEGNYTVSGAGTYTAVDNQRPLVTINASAMNNAGEDFLYWIDEETKDIVSYDRAYAFNCIKNVVLTPVYGDGSSLAVEPVIRIADVRYDAASGKVSFYSERSIGEDYVLYETGIIVTRTQSIAANEDSFVLGGVSTAKGTSTSTAPYGTYSVNVSVSAQETVWARAYAVVETADGEIIEVYGDIVPYTNK